jgi:hypothetical protein
MFTSINFLGHGRITGAHVCSPHFSVPIILPLASESILSPEGHFTNAAGLLMDTSTRTFVKGRVDKETENETRIIERTVSKGLNRYGPSKPLDALRCLPRNELMFYINAASLLCKEQYCFV